MIITLSGVTGVGKSFYKSEIVKNLGVENLVIYTTRPKRENEIAGIDKNFATLEEINKKIENGSLFAAYTMCGETYAYDSKYKNPAINSVTELHYEWISDFKEKAKNVYAIYMVPSNIEIAKEELRKRNLPNDVYLKRLQEIEEHQKRIKEDEKLRNCFDTVFYNEYNKESLQKMLELVKKIMNKN